MTEIETIKRPWFDPAAGLMIAITTLLCLGGLMVFSAGAGLDQQIRLERFWEYATMRRLAFVPICLVILAVLSRWNYRRWLVWEKHFWFSPVHLLLGGAVVLLILVLIPGVGTAVNESRRWFRFAVGGQEITFQPSELAKWSLILFLAAYAARAGDGMRDFKKGFLPTCGILLLVVGLIGKEDFGTAALVGFVALSLLLAAGLRWWYLAALIPLAGLAFYVLVYSDPHRWARVLAFFFEDRAAETAYHAQQSVMAIGVGGLWGTGLGAGTVKLGWLPEDTTDFIFAVIGEELGLFGVCLVIGLYILLIICALVVMRRTNNPLNRLLALGVTLMIGTQAAMNLCVVTALAPTKGIALPFVSAGGSGLVLTTVAAGILVNIARQTTSPTREDYNKGYEESGLVPVPGQVV